MALECVEFVDYASQEELGSSLADIVTQLAQDVSFPIPFSSYCQLLILKLLSIFVYFLSLNM